MNDLPQKDLFTEHPLPWKVGIINEGYAEILDRHDKPVFRIQANAFITGFNAGEVADYLLNRITFYKRHVRSPQDEEQNAK